MNLSVSLHPSIFPWRCCPDIIFSHSFRPQLPTSPRRTGFSAILFRRSPPSSLPCHPLHPFSIPFLSCVLSCCFRVVVAVCLYVLVYLHMCVYMRAATPGKNTLVTHVKKIYTGFFKHRPLLT